MTKQKNELTTGGFALTTFEQMEDFAEKLATSGMLGGTNKAQAFIIAEHCSKTGLSFLQYKQRYHTTKDGGVLIRADYLQARFQELGGTIRWIETTDKVAKAAFTYGANVDWEQSYTWEQAQRAGLTNKESYKAHPEDLLRKNLVAKTINAICPEAKGGHCIAEEMPDGLDGERVVQSEPVPVDADWRPSMGKDLDYVEDAEEVLDAVQDTPEPEPDTDTEDTDPTPFDDTEDAEEVDITPVDFSVCPMPYKKQDGVPFETFPVEHLKSVLASKHPDMEQGHYDFVNELLKTKTGE